MIMNWQRSEIPPFLYTYMKTTRNQLRNIVAQRAALFFEVTDGSDNITIVDTLANLLTSPKNKFNDLPYKRASFERRVPVCNKRDCQNIQNS